MDELKIYGMCLGRLRYQIGRAKGNARNCGDHVPARILLESYNTSDIDDLVDILELYDLEGRAWENLEEKLEDLAQTVSALASETLMFDLTEEGHLGLYLLSGEAADAVSTPRPAIAHALF
jgi:hypothetical protein